MNLVFLYFRVIKCYNSLKKQMYGGEFSENYILEYQ